MEFNFVLWYNISVMKSQVLNYRILVEKEKQDKKVVYVAYVPSLGISDFGKTIDQAVSHLEKAMKLYINTLIEINQPVPTPDTDDYFVTSRKISIEKYAKSSFV